MDIQPRAEQAAKAALIYCRVSTKGQEEDGTSLDSQEAACMRHAEALGITLDQNIPVESKSQRAA